MPPGLILSQSLVGVDGLRPAKIITPSGLVLAASAGIPIAGVIGLSDAPIFSAINPDHVLHVFEDFSAYATVGQVGVANRGDGGGPWQNDGLGTGRQSLLTSGIDPWFGVKALRLDITDAPAVNTAHEVGLVLVNNGTPARILNNASTKDSFVIEWAWRWNGAPYEGKIVDFQPYPGTDRFNYQTDPDQLGLQSNGGNCNGDTLCNHWYSANGNTPRFANMPPNASYGEGAVARSISALDPYFYRENMNWKAGSFGTDGFVDWGGSSWSTIGQNLVGRWNRTILRYTRNLNGVMGQGRVEEWFQTAGFQPIKVMQFYGDPGQLDAGLIKGRDEAQGGSSWFVPAGVMYWYDLTAVGGIYVGGCTLDYGYMRMWSHSRLGV